MTTIGIAAILVGAAFAVLVGYLVPLLIQVRKAVAEAGQLLIKMNDELPPLIRQIQATSHNLIELTEQARIGAKHATVLFHAVGEVGESVQHVHRFVKGSSGSMLTKVASMVTGLIGASKVLKGRYREERGNYHNGDLTSRAGASPNEPSAR